MRVVAHIAALIGLLAFGAAFGDWVSTPNLLGGAALVVLFLALCFALGQLYRPGGPGSSRTGPEQDLEARDRGPGHDSTPADVVLEAPRRRRTAAPGSVWASGWDAQEAKESRARRRGKR